MIAGADIHPEGVVLTFVRGPQTSDVVIPADAFPYFVKSVNEVWAHFLRTQNRRNNP